MNQIKNVLVLGSPDVDIAQFLKLFGVYVNFDGYDEAIKWEPALTPLPEHEVYDEEEEDEVIVNETTRSSLVIGNRKINFIIAPKLDVAEGVSKQIIPVLLYFIQKQQITAIIFLGKSTEELELVWQYRNCLLSKFKQFDFNNILYIFACDKYEPFLSNRFRQERSEFYFEGDKYFKISNDNWKQSREFCKSVYNYIMGEDNTNGLQDINIQSKIPKKSVLILVDDLMELLILIYISVEFCILTCKGEDYYRCYIGNYKKNVSTCFGSNCIEWVKHQGTDIFLKWEIPKICHDPCNFEFYGRCTMFDTADETCLKCKCGVDSHSKHFFIYGVDGGSKYRTTFEKCIALNNLATFSLYKRQNQETYNIENILHKLLDLGDSKHQEIFNNFNNEFNEEVQKLENITEENILTCLNELYKIKEAAEMIPKFLDEMFPKDIQLEIIPEESIEVIDMKREIEILKNENAELQQKLNA